MINSKCIFTFVKTVSYYETDRMNVVHHSNYIRWFEDARVDFLEKAGMPYHTIENNGLMLPVLSAYCEYKNPAKFGDKIRVESAVTFFNGVKFEVEYEVYNNETNVLCAIGKTSHCFVNDDFRPLRIKKLYPDIYDALNRICVCKDS